MHECEPSLLASGDRRSRQFGRVRWKRDAGHVGVQHDGPPFVHAERDQQSVELRRGLLLVHSRTTSNNPRSSPCAAAKAWRSHGPPPSSPPATRNSTKGALRSVAAW